jgi:hypothetical protein
MRADVLSTKHENSIFSNSPSLEGRGGWGEGAFSTHHPHPGPLP